MAKLWSQVKSYWHINNRDDCHRQSAFYCGFRCWLSMVVGCDWAKIYPEKQKVLPHRHAWQCAQKKIKNKLIAPENSGSHLAFTINCWAGDAESLMSLTCHFIDKNWERKQVIFNVKAMFGSHTGEYISQMFLNMLDQWQISWERVVLVLRDGGANVVKGMQLAEMPDFSCCAHTCNL